MIRTCINARDLNSQLENLEACAEDAPEGAYDHAKRINTFFGETFQHLRGELNALGLKLDNSDRYREFEAILYGLIKDSNPDCSTFAVSEGFGSAMSGPARERVIDQAKASVKAVQVVVDRAMQADAEALAKVKAQYAAMTPDQQLNHLFGIPSAIRAIAQHIPGVRIIDEPDRPA